LDEEPIEEPIESWLPGVTIEPSVGTIRVISMMKQTGAERYSAVVQWSLLGPEGSFRCVSLSLSLCVCVCGSEGGAYYPLQHQPAQACTRGGFLACIGAPVGAFCTRDDRYPHFTLLHLASPCFTSHSLTGWVCTPATQAASA
jgi:hypothetical protein